MDEINPAKGTKEEPQENALPCGCVPHKTRMTGLFGFYCDTEQQGYCNFECPHEDDDKVETIYPVTIMKARYGGGYEGGAWLAFNCDPWDVPRKTIGDDPTCANFFDEYNKSNRKKNPLKIGRGNTPDEALKDLVAQFYVD